MGVGTCSTRPWRCSARQRAYSDFTVDAVAKRADVARGTIYYQFKSKAGLLDALCDELGRRGGIENLANAFTKADPNEALATFVTTFARFWQVDRPVMRRLRALAHLDPDIHAVIAARDERRREGLQELVKRFATSSTQHDHVRQLRLTSCSRLRASKPSTRSPHQTRI